MYLIANLQFIQMSCHSRDSEWVSRFLIAHHHN